MTSKASRRSNIRNSGFCANEVEVANARLDLRISLLALRAGREEGMTTSAEHAEKLNEISDLRRRTMYLINLPEELKGAR